MENTKSSTSKERTLEKNAEHIIAAHLMMEHSLIPLMTEESHWNLYVVQG